MDRRQVLVGMTAMGVAGSLNLDNLLSAQSIGSPSRSSTARFYPPDLDLNEPRGPVKMCIAETEFDGRKSVEITEYGPGGKWLSTRHETDGRLTYDSSSPELVRTEVRDFQGRLIKSTDGKVGEALRETEYIYDDSDRLLTYIHYGFSRTEYHYAADGSSISVQTFDPKTIEQYQHAVCEGEEWMSTYCGGGVPMGGYVTTTYDKNQNPIELQVRSADGELVTRMVRSYDAEGQLMEEKLLQQNRAFVVLERLERMPPEQRPCPERMQALAKGMNVIDRGKLPLGTKYTYDDQGRLIQKRERSALDEQTTIIEYNKQGDRSRWRQTFKDNSVVPMGAKWCFDEDGNPVITDPGPEGNYRRTDIDIRYAYQYDSYGNWTEKVESRNDELEFITRRTITYY